MSVSRREFLTATAAGGLAAGALTAADQGPTGIPTRVLGKTGARVSILAMGGGSRFLLYPDDDKAVEAVKKVLDLGITYIDTADDYSNHLSEQSRWEGELPDRGREPEVLAGGADRFDPHPFPANSRGPGAD
jgi:hypothetical protein